MIGKRISVVGASGSGKSHVSRILAELLQLKAHELDELRDSLPGVQIDPDEFRRHVQDLIQKDTWIIDGHYLAVRHMIWQRSDTVVLLNYPLHVVFTQLANRYLKKKLGFGAGTGRKSCSSGSKDPGRKMGSWRQRWNRLLKTFRERQDYRRTLCLPQYDKLTVIELKSRKATTSWLQTLRSSDIELHRFSDTPDSMAEKGVLSGRFSSPISIDGNRPA